MNRILEKKVKNKVLDREEEWVQNKVLDKEENGSRIKFQITNSQMRKKSG